MYQENSEMQKFEIERSLLPWQRSCQEWFTGEK